MYLEIRKRPKVQQYTGMLSTDNVSFKNLG